jgi:hypothetical protein
MRKNFICSLVVAILFAAGVVWAQNPNASIQENPQILVGPSITQNYSTAGGTGTLTINPPGGSCTYIWEADASPFNGSNTTVTNGFVTLTAGNFVKKWAVGVGATASAMGTGFVYAPAKPIKTNATSITLVTPTGLANATWNISLDYSFGPC